MYLSSKWSSESRWPAARACAFVLIRINPHQQGGRTLFAIELEPRSIYLLGGPFRWAWQHAISETAELRYSITFRTRHAHFKRVVPTGMHNTGP